MADQNIQIYTTVCFKCEIKVIQKIHHASNNGGGIKIEMIFFLVAFLLTSTEKLRYASLLGVRAVTVSSALYAFFARSFRSAVSLPTYHGVKDALFRLRRDHTKIKNNNNNK